MTSRDALKQALSDALPGSKPFSDESAEKVLAAMEGYFRKLIPAHKPIEWKLDTNWIVGGDCAGGPGLSGSHTSVYVMKDADVAELLAAMDGRMTMHFGKDWVQNFELGCDGSAGTLMASAYRRVKAKYK